MELGLTILETQEIERKRIARDLHDSTIQALTGLVHKTELCQKLLMTDPERTMNELSMMTENLRSVINEMRSIIYNLQPVSLNDLGLTATIQRFIDNASMNNAMQIVFRSHGEERELNPVLTLSVYRIIQEACTNSISHSGGNSLVVHLSYLDDSIEIRVEDDGKGFSYNESVREAMAEGHGYGLTIMKERVNLLNGEISIESVKDKGTKILVRIPLGRIYINDKISDANLTL